MDGWTDTQIDQPYVYYIWQQIWMYLLMSPLDITEVSKTNLCLWFLCAHS